MAAVQVHNPDAPITDRQIELVRKLILERSGIYRAAGQADAAALIETYPATHDIHSLTRGEISQSIDAMIATNKVLRNKLRSAVPVNNEHDPITEAGMYKWGETFYKVSPRKYNPEQLRAEKVVTTRVKTYDPTIGAVVEAVHDKGVLKGKPKYKTRFVYNSAAMRQLSPADKLTLEEAATYGMLYANCVNCGRALTNAESVRLGIGPICRGAFR